MEWIQKENTWLLMEKEHEYEQADGMPKTEWKPLGGVEYSDGWFFAWAITKIGHRTEIRCRFELKDAKEDVELYCRENLNPQRYVQAA